MEVRRPGELATGQRGADIACQFHTAVPEGYETVWGFLAMEEPYVLDIMLDPVQSLMREQSRACSLAEQYGYDRLIVMAPPAVAARGVPSAYAFPMAILREVFPTNP